MTKTAIEILSYSRQDNGAESSPLVASGFPRFYVFAH